MNSRAGGSRVGVVIVGHGRVATGLLEAALPIVGDGLRDVICVDAGAGQTPDLQDQLCRAMETADGGLGVLLIVDLIGASPCSCGMKEGSGREFAVVSGMNLAMMLKLASLRDRIQRPHELAAACAESGRRAITVQGRDCSK
ncbi:MAG: PTS sugar transporter subunit IIA [Nannocystaceae bacterium]